MRQLNYQRIIITLRNYYEYLLTDRPLSCQSCLHVLITLFYKICIYNLKINFNRNDFRYMLLVSMYILEEGVVFQFNTKAQPFVYKIVCNADVRYLLPHLSYLINHIVNIIHIFVNTKKSYIVQS